MVRKIIQMIPVNGLYAVYENDGIKEESKVDVLALDDEGEIFPYDMDEKGYFDIPHQASNFIRYITRGKKEKQLCPGYQLKLGVRKITNPFPKPKIS